MIRRLVASGALVALVLGATAPPAGAAESIDEGPWSGSTLNPSPASPAGRCGEALCGVVQRTSPFRPYQITVAITVTEVGSIPCDTPPTEEREGVGTVTFGLSFECNGEFLVTAQGTASDPGGQSDTMDRTVIVRNPAPPVQDVVWTPGADRAIELSWSTAGRPADVTAYQVERQTDGEWAQLAVLSPSTTEFTDRSPPDAGGPTPYRVRADRDGLLSDGGGTTAVVRPAQLPDPDDPTDPDDPSAPSTPTEPDPSGGAPDPAPGPDGGAAASPEPSVPVAGPRTGAVQVPRVGVPAGGFVTPPLTDPQASVDTGFSEELPYGGRELGAQDPVLPDDLGFDPAGGKGLVIPMALGLVLAVWALHLRFLARAAKPEYADARVPIELIDPRR